MLKKKFVELTQRELFYVQKYGNKRLLLKEACKIWRKPSYSALSKRLANSGYEFAVENKIIPKFTVEGNAYLFHISDILQFMDNKHETE